MRLPWLYLLALGACATGAPVGARASLTHYQPFTLPARAPQVPSEGLAAAPLALGPGAREAAVRAARGLVGKRRVVLAGRTFGNDCTGLVRAAYAQAGVELMGAGAAGDNGVTAIYRFAAAHGRLYTGGRPVAGDLVFFKETYDLNRDGHSNDGLTHVGLVDEVEDDGTVVVIHRVDKGVVRYRMNLSHPEAARSPAGARWNDWLRAEKAGAKPQLTGQLFVSYATLLPIEAKLTARR